MGNLSAFSMADNRVIDRNYPDRYRVAWDEFQLFQHLLDKCAYHDADDLVALYTGSTGDTTERMKLWASERGVLLEE